MQRSALMVYALLVTALSLQPGGVAAVGAYDKLAHFFTYAVFACLAWHALRVKRSYWLVCLAILVYSGALEVAQSFIPLRMMSMLDLLANAAGLVAGMTAMYFLNRRRSHA
ncbi:MAG: VanZ family protein [Gammaproteobacteria bacterium]|nr:VanZ family protein [Gammaproteobacteria bacterium]